MQSILDKIITNFVQLCDSVKINGQQLPSDKCFIRQIPQQCQLPLLTTALLQFNMSSFAFALSFSVPLLQLWLVTSDQVEETRELLIKQTIISDEDNVNDGTWCGGAPSANSPFLFVSPPQNSPKLVLKILSPNAIGLHEKGKKS